MNKGEVDVNTILFKDATASGLQNFGLIYGYKREKMKFLNLEGEDWCDTYQYIIEKFLENEKEEIKKRKY